MGGKKIFCQSRAYCPRGEIAGAGGITKNSHRKSRATSKKTPRMSKGRRRHKKIAQKEWAPPQKFAAAPPLSFSQNPAQKQTRASHFKNLKRLPHFLKSAQSPAKGHFFPLFRQKLPKRGGIFKAKRKKRRLCRHACGAAEESSDRRRCSFFRAKNRLTACARMVSVQLTG